MEFFHLSELLELFTSINPFTQLIIAMVACTLVVRYALFRVERQLKKIPVRIKDQVRREEKK